jgi:hypothetical protein
MKLSDFFSFPPSKGARGIVFSSSGFVIVKLGLNQGAKIGKKKNRKETRQKLTTFAP